MFRFGDPGGKIFTSTGTDHVNLLSHWTALFGASGAYSIQSVGRLGGNCLRFIYAGSAYLQKNLDNQSTYGLALAFRPDSLLDGATIGGFRDSNTTQCDLRMYVNGSIQFTCNGTLIGSPSNPSILIPGVWNHVEMKVTAHNTNGSVQAWINGISVIGPTTSLNTIATANLFINQIFIGQTNTTNWSTNNYFEDIIVYDGQTTDANGNPAMTGPIGDVGLNWLLPTGAGTTTQFTPDSGSNFARVNEATPDTTSYVESATLNHIDSYAMADLPTSLGVKAIASVVYARKTDVGSKSLAPVIRTNSTNYTHPTNIALSDSYKYDFRNWDSNPNGGVAWTPTAVNALEAGQKVTS